jgi:hypothetical protein
MRPGTGKVKGGTTALHCFRDILSVKHDSNVMQ